MTLDDVDIEVLLLDRLEAARSRPKSTADDSLEDALTGAMGG
jgi:hypothetical protein